MPAANDPTSTQKLLRRPDWLHSVFPKQPLPDILSGMTVALALVPEAIAFAFVAGVNPMIGLYSAFIIGLLTSILGGRPGMISGATGAMAVVVVALVAIHDVTYLFPTVILCGILQCLVGIFRLGKLIRLVPHSVMLGFVNGLAIVIGLAQLSSFKELGTDGFMHYFTGSKLFLMLGGVALTMAIIHFLPKLTKAVPSSLAAILVVTGLAIGINSFNDDKPFMTVEDMMVQGSEAKAIADAAKDLAKQDDQKRFDAALAAGLIPEEEAEGGAPTTKLIASEVVESKIKAMPEEQIQMLVAGVDPDDGKIKGGLPKLYFMDKAYDVLPPLNWATFMIILPFAVILAGVGLIESLMTLSLIDEITETRGRGNKECVGQGVANITCGLFGGMGGCAMIGQSLINVNSGGRNRLSGIVAALLLLAFILFLGPWIGMIPMAALVGVMFMVVIGTFEWASIKMFKRMPKADMLVMVTVVLITVFMHNLALAVLVGVIMAALVFAWQHATHIGAEVKLNETGENSKTYQLHGPLFFASVESFKELFTPAEDPDDVIIDFYFTRVYDQSGLEAINVIADKYRAQGKKLHLYHLSEECAALLDKAGDLVEVNISEDPHYHVATDRLG